jgi:hypothetical protein
LGPRAVLDIAVVKRKLRRGCWGDYFTYETERGVGLEKVP